MWCRWTRNKGPPEWALEILVRLSSLTSKTEDIMSTLEEVRQALAELAVEVAAEKTTEDSAIALLTELVQMLKDALAGGTPQEIVDSVKAITAQVDQQTAALAAAVQANTPTT